MLVPMVPVTRSDTLPATVFVAYNNSWRQFVFLGKLGTGDDGAFQYVTAEEVELDFGVQTPPGPAVADDIAATIDAPRVAAGSSTARFSTDCAVDAAGGPLKPISFGQLILDPGEPVLEIRVAQFAGCSWRAQ